MKDLSFLKEKAFTVGDSVFIGSVIDFCDDRTPIMQGGIDGTITDIQVSVGDTFDCSVTLETFCPFCKHKETVTLTNKDRTYDDLKRGHFPLEKDADPFALIVFCDDNGGLHCIHRKRTQTGA